MEKHPDPRPRLVPERDYPAICHICAREFIVRAEFWSAGSSARGAAGDERLVTTCNILHDETAHAGEDVRASYLAGGWYDQARELDRIMPGID